ncbi:MAG: hypothetical protein V7696_15905 [Halioglobus sp.]
MSWLKPLKGRYQVASDPLRSTRRVELAVMLLLILLVVQLVWGVSRLLVLTPTDSVPPAADALQVLSMTSQPDVTAEERNEMLARPLFWVSRRPLDGASLVDTGAAETATQAKAAAKELKEIKLLGVFGSEQSTGIIALVKGKKTRLMQGDSHKGWTLESVKANEVTFSDGVSVETLVLKKAVITAPPPSPSAANESSEENGEENDEENRDDSGDEKTEQASAKKVAEPVKRSLSMDGR